MPPQLVRRGGRAGRRRHGAVRLPLLPDGPRGAGPGRQRSAGRRASSTAATCRTGCRPSRTTTGASTPSCRRPLARLRRHRLALVRPRRVRHRRSPRLGVRRARDGGAGARPRAATTSTPSRPRRDGDGGPAAAVDHRGRGPGPVPHRRRGERLGGGQPDLGRPQEPAAPRGRRPTAPRWPSTRSTPTPSGWGGAARRRSSSATRTSSTRPRRRTPPSRPATRRATRTASTPSSPTRYGPSRSATAPRSTGCRPSPTAPGPSRITDAVLRSSSDGGWVDVTATADAKEVAP